MEWIVFVVDFVSHVVGLASYHSNPKSPTLEFAVAELIECVFANTGSHRNVSAVVEDFYFTHLRSGNAVLAGERTQYISGAQLVSFSTTDLQSNHGRRVDGAIQNGSAR